MKIIKTVLGDAKLVELPRFMDRRGSFTKLYAESLFRNGGIAMEVREIYYSLSALHVIRGMHFQKPPAEHAKFVTVLDGAVRDVILDLRSNSPSYGHYAEITLNADKAQGFFIPPGFAHGFMSLRDNTLMQYMVSSEHSPEHDSGIRWDSFGFSWGLDRPIVSDRDRALPGFNDLKSPF
jgi:dTDP-4-dehydrorhamnose 3,5-epimerase